MGSVEEFVAKRFRPSFCDVPPVVLGRSAPTPIGLSYQDHPLATCHHYRLLQLRFGIWCSLIGAERPRTRDGTSQKLGRNDRVWGGRGADRLCKPMQAA